MSTDTVEKLVRDGAVAIEQETTVEEAIKAVMDFTPADGTVYYVYVLDDENLVGVVSMRELLNATNTERVSAIMTTDIVSLAVDESLETAAREIVETRYAALPVVDGTGTYLGTFHAHDVIDALDERTIKQLFKSSWPWI